MPLDVKLVALLLAPVLFILVFKPDYASAKFFRLSKPSRLWVRLHGAFATIWLVLVVTTTSDNGLPGLSKDAREVMVSFQKLSLGIAVGLLIAINTKQRD